MGEEHTNSVLNFNRIEHLIRLSQLHLGFSAHNLLVEFSSQKFDSGKNWELIRKITGNKHQNRVFIQLQCMQNKI